jgi:hypothetical protein
LLAHSLTSHNPHVHHFSHASICLHQVKRRQHIISGLIISTNISGLNLRYSTLQQQESHKETSRFCGKHKGMLQAHT